MITNSAVACDRCNELTETHILSFFNEDDICMTCKDIEEAHPDYDNAREAEAEAIRTGDPHDFVGIGLPADLVVAKVGA